MPKIQYPTVENGSYYKTTGGGFLVTYEIPNLNDEWKLKERFAVIYTGIPKITAKELLEKIAKKTRVKLDSITKSKKNPDTIAVGKYTGCSRGAFAEVFCIKVEKLGSGGFLLQ